MMIRTNIRGFALACLMGLSLSCSQFDFQLPEGPSGKAGAEGRSAYELWKTEVLAQRIAWAGGTDLTDFFLYLKGTDGRNGSEGKSAYEQWKNYIKTGTVPNPHKPSESWPPSQDGEADFWYFLSGTRGEASTAGRQGLSAYELWRDELARRCGTEQPMKDPHTGEIWACEDNSLEYFFAYLRGRDGKDGKNGQDGRSGSDGRPTPPGTVGEEVQVIIGKPNVIAQYSIQTKSEYILPEGVRYRVYWEDGELAPHALVKGLPGISPDKSYQADEKGEFVVPLEDLPFRDEISFGRVEEVHYKGKTIRSANNTYVPNKFIYEFRVVNTMKFIYADRMQGTMSLRVKRAPSKPWEAMPLYFQTSQTKVHAYRISDPSKPHSFVLDSKGEKLREVWAMDYHLSYVIPARPAIESKRAPKGRTNFWDGDKRYYLCDFNFGSFPGLIREALIIEVPPIQYAPRIKSLALKTRRQTEGGVSYFEGVTGEIDTEGIDFGHIYSVQKRDFSTFETGQRILFPPLSREEIERYQLYVRFRYRKQGVSHDVVSSPKHPTLLDPSFKALLPYVGSVVGVDFDWSSSSGLAHNVSWLPDQTGGTLKYAPNGRDFLVTFDAGKFPNLQPITITYED